MNYVAEINSFHNWVMFNRLPADAQALWHTLMHINNRCAVNVNGSWYWRVEFSIPNDTLSSMLAFSRQQLDRMRNVLIQKGRIMYRKGKGSQGGTYKIIPFDNSIVENYVDNFPDKVWITIDAQYVTQYVTQSATQSGHNQLHKADTNPDLCNNMSTQINSNNIKNNNIYNNSFGDDVATHAREKNTQSHFSDFLAEINDYFGVTDEIKTEAQQITEELFDKYLSRRPCKNDIVNVFHIIRHSEQDEKGRWTMTFDKDKREILDYAFQQAANAGCRTWAYINGVLDNIRNRGLKTLNDCERYDFDRNEARGKI